MGMWDSAAIELFGGTGIVLPIWLVGWKKSGG
jgi:hypothetical protein